jgi:hypothetical protein
MPEAFSITGTQISSVAPGYTVDSKTIVAPRFRLRPTASLAESSGPKSGWCALSIGVGTATTMKSAARSAAASVVQRKPVAAASSAALTSPVGSTPRP